MADCNPRIGSEVIRRDEETDFANHEFLGVTLNGLLPRRARPMDLGKNDWRDLAWLLELNQGFYNAAGLAAVCSLTDKDTGSWLGKPVDPAVGSERLEPVVTAFPVYADRDPPLAIIGGETVAFRKVLLRRDAFGLYTNEEMRPLKILCICLALFLIFMGIILLGSFDIVGGLLLWYFTAVSYRMVELLWGEKLELKLGEQDSHFRTLKPWGSKQMIPKWSAPKGSFKGKLPDLKTCVYTEVIVVAVSNAIVPLAIQGSGVACMLLERAEDQDKELESNLIARKVGMCNLPPYIILKCGTVHVGPIPIPPKC
ncbi:hypothetical protein GGX14DRAFT_564292 [Mycena pura]|uniref:Uncharacterized protein n=1 Tax=Mycena pura TaxID=153505 RepID=A0AAD6YD04_9AGAR|nr:hypothetical protein GGX14DRAFT_564292 [Mycena pura]